MNEQTKKIVTGIVVFIVFVVCMAMVIMGHKHVGPGGLMVMLVGLTGLIFLLWLYNRQYK